MERRWKSIKDSISNLYRLATMALDESAGDEGVVKVIKDFYMHYNFSVLVLLEPQISVEQQAGSNWYFSAIYGHSKHNLRRDLWEELTLHTRRVNRQWMLVVLIKVITNRLKPFMSVLIVNTQASLIPRKVIIDNIIVAQEVIHSCRKKKGQVGWMMIKIDLEKAHDELRWEFVHDTLVEARIPTKIIDVLLCSWRCFSTQILWNGSPTESFVPSRRVRQGDLLLPYLFEL
ncbi:Uncharacterized protein TCM_018607 [Theobroma cacao]|uniref:Reverse transcriptase domain-containing protein n=1 Tax=Theobroma cacao TaxID=3641 RepID=A0A061EEZ4_THECC|nr:Uncharacterized protein TCM_018607 [Theobroma cacao]